MEMAETGQGARALIAPAEDASGAREGLFGARAMGAYALMLALLGGLAMWGFTVDDAWIPVRYARHVASGAGYVFNAGGPRTDGVTPLPFPFVLAPFAGGSAAAVLIRAKCMGLAAWTLAAYALGRRVGRAPSPLSAKLVGLAVLALAVPTAAHAVSGLETGLAIALATFAVTALDRPLLAAALAGAVASLRPEMAPWALVLGAGAAVSAAHAGGLAGGAAWRRVSLGAAVALVPFAVCVALRLVVFGRAAPLAVWAKPSDLEHGLVYVAVGAVVTLTPILVLPSRALLRAPPEARVVVLAALVHLAAVAAVGGDWMPYARLVAPIAPSLALAFVLAAPTMSRWAFWLRGALALGLGTYLAVVAAPAGRQVTRDREALAARAAPELRHARRVAALDVGWPTEVTEAEIVDLAGLTDPEIAALPGGHTSKRIDVAYLIARAPDVVLLYVTGGVDGASLDRWRDATYTRLVEARFAESDLFAAHFTPRAFFPLGAQGAGYVVLARVPP